MRRISSLTINFDEFNFKGVKVSELYLFTFTISKNVLFYMD